MLFCLKSQFHEPNKTLSEDLLYTVWLLNLLPSNIFLLSFRVLLYQLALREQC